MLQRPHTQLSATYQHAFRRALMLAVMCCFSFSLIAQECLPVGQVFSEALAKKEAELAQLESVFRSNSAKFSAQEARYSKAGYQPLNVSERARIFEDLLKEAGDQKAVFDLRLNSKARELSPLLRAHHQAQIVDPKIVDGKLIARLNGSSPELSHTVEIPLDAIDNLAFWKGLERQGQRRVVSFADPTGKALEDFMKSVGSNKSAREYTEAFSKMRGDWNQQNDILAAIDAKAARGQGLSDDEFLLGLMVDRNRTSRTPARMSAFENAYKRRNEAMKGAEPDAKALLADIPMDAAMRERAERLLSAVKGERLPPAVVARTTDVQEVGTGTQVAIRGSTDIVPASDEAAKATNALEGEIYLPGEPIPGSNLRDVNPTGVRETGTEVVVVPTRAPVTIEGEVVTRPGTEVTVRPVDSESRALVPTNTVTEANKVDDVALDGEIYLRDEPIPSNNLKDVNPTGVRETGTEVAVVPARDDVIDVVPNNRALTLRTETPPAVIPTPSPQAVSNFMRRTRASITAALTGAAAYLGLRSTSSVDEPEVVPEVEPTDASTDEPAPEPGEEPVVEPTPVPSPTTTVADSESALNDAEMAAEFENLVISANLNEKTKNKPENEWVIKVSVTPESPNSKAFLDSGYFDLVCGKDDHEKVACNYKADKGVLEITRKLRRQKDKDYSVGVYWLFPNKKDADREDYTIKVPALDCEVVVNEVKPDPDMLAACELSDEEYIPSFDGVSGPQLSPPPTMTPLRPRGVYITPGFN